MNSVFVFVLCLVALAFATMDDSLFMAKFQEFKLKHQKSYASKDEEAKRFQIFKANVIAAEERNQRDPYAHFGVTKFSDMTPKEFKSIILMTNISQPEQPKLAGRKFPASPSLPTSFDWKTKSNIVTTVKDQGQCGSCWDFSATETIESVCALAGYPLTKLSEQQILDCDTSDYGCNGGWPYLAYKYVIAAGGLESESDYPYSAEDGSCSFNPSDIECKVQSWKYVTQNKDENAMQNFLYSNSPLSVCVDAEIWQYYTGGVITTSSGCGRSIDHCVQVTGWQQMQGMTVWNVRNSWGTSWGDNGYIYVQKGSDVCAIAEVVTVPCVQNKSNGQSVC